MLVWLMTRIFVQVTIYIRLRIGRDGDICFVASIFPWLRHPAGLVCFYQHIIKLVISGTNTGHNVCRHCNWTAQLLLVGGPQVETLRFGCNTRDNYTPVAKYIYIAVVQRRPSVFDAGPALHKCYTNVLCYWYYCWHFHHNQRGLSILICCRY